MSLTPEQHAAAHYTGNRLVIVAPPGSGKTHTLAARVTAINAGSVPGDGALAITFTNKSARELAERTEGKAEAHTFHGLCARILRMGRDDDWTLYDATDQQNVACLAGEESGVLKPGGYKDRRRAAAKVLANAEGRLRYRALMARYHGLDYEMLVDEGLKHAPGAGAYRFGGHQVLVDEAQDTDPKQWRLVEALSPRAVCIVGDPRQQIYGWRGGTADGLLHAWERAKDESSAWGRQALTANFRSLPCIVNLGNVIASGMALDAPPMVAHRAAEPEGLYNFPVQALGFDSSDEEACDVAAVAYAHSLSWESGAPSVFVLGRTWRALERVREALEANGVPHLHLGKRGDFWSEYAVRAVLHSLHVSVSKRQDWRTRIIAGELGVTQLDIAKAAERSARSLKPLVVEVSDDTHTLRALEMLPVKPSDAIRDIGEMLNYAGTGRPTKAAQVEQLRERALEWERDATDVTIRGWLDYLGTKSTQDEAAEAPVWLSTVHGVKGLEAPSVAVVGMHGGGFDASPTDPEERRLWFVAATRAKDRLLCTYNRKHGTRGPGVFWTEAKANG